MWPFDHVSVIPASVLLLRDLKFVHKWYSLCRLGVCKDRTGAVARGKVGERVQTQEWSCYKGMCNKT